MTISSQLTITEDALIDMAHRSHAFLRSKGVLHKGQPIGFAFCLQTVCRSLYGKSYEEVRRLLGSTGPAVSVAVSTPSRVVLVHYRGEAILMCNGEYISASYPGTDLETPLRQLQDMGERLAAQHGTSFREVSLPEILSPDYETDDVIDLAERMGYVSGVSIFEALEAVSDGHKKVFINGDHVPYGLNGDWHDEMVEAIEHDADPMETSIWSPEWVSEKGAQEAYITFGALCEATVNADGTVWSVPYGKQSFLVSFC